MKRILSLFLVFVLVFSVIQMTVSAKANLDTNLLKKRNPTFINGTVGITADDNYGIIEAISGDKMGQDDNYCIKMTNGNRKANAYAGGRYIDTVLEPGKTYLLSAWIKAVDETGGGKAWLYFDKRGGLSATGTQPVVSKISYTADDWTQIYVIYTSDLGSEQGYKCHIGVKTDNTNDVYLDNFQVCMIDSDYIAIKDNLLNNPSFEDGTTNWTNSNGSVLDCIDAPDGFGYKIAYSGSRSSSGAGYYQTIDTTANTYYYMSAMIKLENENTNGYKADMRLQKVQGTGNNIYGGARIVPTDTGWSKIENICKVIDATQSKAYIAFGNSADSSYPSFYSDNYIVRKITSNVSDNMEPNKKITISGIPADVIKESKISITETDNLSKTISFTHSEEDFDCTILPTGMRSSTSYTLTIDTSIDSTDSVPVFTFKTKESDYDIDLKKNFFGNVICDFRNNLYDDNFILITATYDENNVLIKCDADVKNVRYGEDAKFVTSYDESDNVKIMFWKQEIIKPLIKSVSIDEISYLEEYETNILPNSWKGWNYSVKAGTNAEGTVSYTEDDGYLDNGCVLYDMTNSGTASNSLQWYYRLSNSGGTNVIEAAQEYVVAFYAKLIGNKEVSINSIRLRSPSDNTDNYSYEIQTVDILPTGNWEKYFVTLTANISQTNAFLMFQAGGESAENFKLYIDNISMKKVVKGCDVKANIEDGISANDVYVNCDGKGISPIIADFFAASNKSSGLLFKGWKDSYGNFISENSIYTIPNLSKDISLTACFDKYDYNVRQIDISKGTKFDLHIDNTSLTNTDFNISGNIQIPENTTMLDCGVITYPGYYTENFNIFSENTNTIPIDSISSNGEFVVQNNIETADFGILAKIYTICEDASGHIFIQYSTDIYTESPNQIAKKEYKQIYNHELLCLFTGSKTHNPEVHAEFVDKFVKTGCDAVTVTPGMWRTNLWYSEVDGFWAEEAEKEGNKSLSYYEDAKKYILGGGDPVKDTYEAIKKYDGVDFFINYRMNDHHYTNDITWPTHGTFWRNNSQYWLYNSNESTQSRLFNYMYPGVREYYYNVLEELVKNYDVDGIELDFNRYPLYFYPTEIAEGTTVMTNFIGSIREMINHYGVLRGKRIQLSVRVPRTIRLCSITGLDIEKWDDKKYVDIYNVSSYYNNTMEIGLKEFIDNTENAEIIGEINYVSYQVDTSNRRYLTKEGYFATASNFKARGADGISFFNMPYVPSASQAELMTAMADIKDDAKLARAEKDYIISRGFGTFPSTNKTFTVNIPDNPSDFSSSLLRVELANDNADVSIVVTLNGYSLSETEYDGVELFTALADNSAYPTKNRVKFYSIPMEVLKSGENSFSVKNVSGSQNNIQSVEIAIYQ